MEGLGVFAVGQLGGESEEVGVTLGVSRASWCLAKSASDTHGDGEVLLVELLLVDDVFGLEHRLEDVGLSILISLEVSGVQPFEWES